MESFHLAQWGGLFLEKLSFFFAPNTSSDVPPFVRDRMKRHGPIFKTSLVGRPVIVSTDADLNYLFQSWYPDTFTEIFGKENVGSLHGFMYKYLKNMVLKLFGPESLKKMLLEVEQASNRSLNKWSIQAMRVLKNMLQERRERPSCGDSMRWQSLVLGNPNCGMTSPSSS